MQNSEQEQTNDSTNSKETEQDPIHLGVMRALNRVVQEYREKQSKTDSATR